MVILDLFCGAGGAAVGYHRAGFEVVGVDIQAQPNYPYEFYQADALDMVRMVADQFDLIHASPPCQAYSALNAVWQREYPDLIDATRDALLHAGRPWVIENVPPAPIRKDLMLCGEMFGLGVIRHRHFEVHDFHLTQPAHKPHRGLVKTHRRDGYYFPVYGDGGGRGPSPNGRGRWASTGRLCGKKSRRPYPPPTPNTSGNSSNHGRIMVIVCRRTPRGWEPTPTYPIGPILESVGAQLPHSIRGGWQPMRCYAHDDARPSASVNFTTNRFYCFSCGINEDGIGVLMNAHGLDFVGALREAESISPQSRPEIQPSGGEWRKLFGG